MELSFEELYQQLISQQVFIIFYGQKTPVIQSVRTGIRLTPNEANNMIGHYGQINTIVYFSCQIWKLLLDLRTRSRGPTSLEFSLQGQGNYSNSGSRNRLNHSNTCSNIRKYSNSDIRQTITPISAVEMGDGHQQFRQQGQQGKSISNSSCRFKEKLFQTYCFYF
ncbi:unnamed protein product [Paramecium octaurelia]|uniref:Uncharacterized protein n=1 Tax=Paramecium octaurelia TaxID=43137 RepID=A0A8S1SSP2_PAROT|nr:unnamed protein product [Paramecium octaurelia]